MDYLQARYRQFRQIYMTGLPRERRDWPKHHTVDLAAEMHGSKPPHAIKRRLVLDERVFDVMGLCNLEKIFNPSEEVQIGNTQYKDFPDTVNTDDTTRTITSVWVYPDGPEAVEIQPRRIMSCDHSSRWDVVDFGVDEWIGDTRDEIVAKGGFIPDEPL